MARLKESIKLETMSGDKAAVGDVSVTPQSQALIVRWPNGGWVWNRPVAVLVDQGTQTERIPIVDVTRVAQLGLLALSAVFTIVTLVLSITSFFRSMKGWRA